MSSFVPMRSTCSKAPRRWAVAIVALMVPMLAGAHASAEGPVGPHNATVDVAYVDQVMYATPLKDFEATARRGDAWFDWTTDGCSAPLVGNTGRSFDFTVSCERHDFGYRNAHQLESRYGSGHTYWNSATRSAVDSQFLRDMRAHCHSRSIFLRPTCYAWAQTFYTAVRLAGGS